MRVLRWGQTNKRTNQDLINKNFVVKVIELIHSLTILCVAEVPLGELDGAGAGRGRRVLQVNPSLSCSEIPE